MCPTKRDHRAGATLRRWSESIDERAAREGTRCWSLPRASPAEMVPPGLGRSMGARVWLAGCDVFCGEPVTRFTRPFMSRTHAAVSNHALLSLTVAIRPDLCTAGAVVVCDVASRPDSFNSRRWSTAETRRLDSHLYAVARVGFAPKGSLGMSITGIEILDCHSSTIRRRMLIHAIAHSGGSAPDPECRARWQRRRQFCCTSGIAKTRRRRDPRRGGPVHDVIGTCDATRSRLRVSRQTANLGARPWCDDRPPASDRAPSDSSSFPRFPPRPLAGAFHFQPAACADRRLRR